MSGGAGDDLVDGQSGSGDTISGGLGNDILDARGFAFGGVTLVGGSVNDVLFIHDGSDGQSGGLSDDYLDRRRHVVDGDTADTLDGEGGADTLRSDPNTLDQRNTDAFDTVSADLFASFPALVDSL